MSASSADQASGRPRLAGASYILCLLYALCHLVPLRPAGVDRMPRNRFAYFIPATTLIAKACKGCKLLCSPGFISIRCAKVFSPMALGAEFCAPGNRLSTQACIEARDKEPLLPFFPLRSILFARALNLMQLFVPTVSTRSCQALTTPTGMYPIRNCVNVKAF